MSSFQWDYRNNIALNAGNILIGIISNIDHDNMTAFVNCDGSVFRGVPIHYHCEEDPSDDGSNFELSYPNDLDEYGSTAFNDGDRVLVMFRDINNTKPLIIGFPNEAKVCESCPECEDLDTSNLCISEENHTYTLIFTHPDKNFKEEGCDEEPDLDSLSDGLSETYRGVFNNHRKSGDNWLVDYTTNENLCDKPYGEEIVICGNDLGGCFLLDEDFSDEEVNEGGTAVLRVKGGKPPFLWEVAESGYSFDSMTTTERFNTLTCAAGT